METNYNLDRAIQKVSLSTHTHIELSQSIPIEHILPALFLSLS